MKPKVKCPIGLVLFLAHLEKLDVNGGFERNVGICLEQK
jgi:hypothetical protein